MSTLLLTFLILFSVLRIFFSTADERHSTFMERVHGTVIEFQEKYCDIPLEKHLRGWVSRQENFVAAWEILEDAWNNKKDQISKMSPRTQKIWSILMRDGRQPFNSRYSREFAIKHGLIVYGMSGYNCWYSSLYNMYWLFAIHCLMSLQGKLPEQCAVEEYRILTHCYREEKDMLRLVDAFKEKIEREKYTIRPWV